MFVKSAIWAGAQKNLQMSYVSSKDSDQPVSDQSSIDTP